MCLCDGKLTRGLVGRETLQASGTRIAPLAVHAHTHTHTSTTRPATIVFAATVRHKYWPRTGGEDVGLASWVLRAFIAVCVARIFLTTGALNTPACCRCTACLQPEAIHRRFGGRANPHQACHRLRDHGRRGAGGGPLGRSRSDHRTMPRIGARVIVSREHGRSLSRVPTAANSIPTNCKLPVRQLTRGVPTLALCSQAPSRTSTCPRSS